jgi:hypothetical protein
MNQNLKTNYHHVSNQKHSSLLLDLYTCALLFLSGDCDWS